MKPARFDYRRPETIEETFQLLSDHGRDAAILAGGQSLIPMLNRRLAKPTVLIDIKHLSPLEQILVDQDRLIIGSLMRHADVMNSQIVQSRAPLVAEAIRHMAHPAIRNRGTIGGSLAFADPAAELPACAVCLGAEIVTGSIRGERRIPAEEFFTGPSSTTLDGDEIILRMEFPLPSLPWICAFEELARRKNDVAIVGLAFAINAMKGKVRECRIVFCGVETRPRRISAAEAHLAETQRHSFPGAVQEAQRELVKCLAPVGSAEYPAGYRLHVAGALLGRATARDEVMDALQ
jgi:carbon-monoxide dehydrogenase medium subunit